MTPSKEAIEAALGQVTVYGSREKEDMLDALNAFIAIDVAPLEQRIRDLEMAHADAMALVLSHEGHIEMLEKENQQLKAQLERKGGDVE